MAGSIKQVEMMDINVAWKFKGAWHKPWYDCILENWAKFQRG